MKKLLDKILYLFQFKKSNQIFSSNIFIIFLLVVIFMFFTNIDVVNAAKETSDIQETIGEFASIIVHFIVYLSWLVISMIGDLLGNDIIMHPVIEPILRLMWTVIRNFVNITFVGVLLYVAFRTIFDLQGGNDFLKTNLPRIALALVLVNFSFLGMKVLLDVSTVATNAAFSLGSLLEGGIQTNLTCSDSNQNCAKLIYSIKINSFKTGKNDYLLPICTDDNSTKACRKLSTQKSLNDMVFVIPVQEGSTTSDKKIEDTTMKEDTLYEYAKLNHLPNLPVSNQAKTWIKNWSGSCRTKDEKTGILKDKTNCSLEEYLKYRKKIASVEIRVQNFKNFGESSNRNLVAMIAQNLTPLERFMTRDSETQTIGQLILEILFSALMSIILLLAFIALFLVLIVRVAILWSAIILCPLVVFALFDILGSIKSKVSEFIGTVVHYAFIPAMFGVVLSLTFIIIGQLMYTETINLGGNEYILAESLLANSNNSLFNLLLMLLAIVLIWMAVFAALSVQFATWAIEPIKNNAQNFGKWLAELPLSMDLVPVATTTGGDTIDVDLKSLWKSMNPMNKVDTSGDKMRDIDRILAGRPQIKNDALSGLVKHKIDFPKEILDKIKNVPGGPGTSEALKILQKEFIEKHKNATELKKAFNDEKVDQHDRALALVELMNQHFDKELEGTSFINAVQHAKGLVGGLNRTTKLDIAINTDQKFFNQNLGETDVSNLQQALKNNEKKLNIMADQIGPNFLHDLTQNIKNAGLQQKYNTITKLIDGIKDNKDDKLKEAINKASNATKK